MTSSWANWLSDQDMTTVATDRATAPASRPTTRAEASASRHLRRTGPTGALTFLASVWLALSSFPFYFRYEALWNDVVIGSAIAAVSLARVAKPAETSALGWVNIVLGGWLLIAPFAWGYGTEPGAARTVWNDVAVGLAVVLLSGMALLPATTAPDRKTVPGRAAGTGARTGRRTVRRDDFIPYE